MPVYKPGTPEARLADLLDLAERSGRARAYNPSDALMTALEAAEDKIAERIRATAAEIGAAPAAPEPRPFKVGDRVRVARHVGASLNLGRFQVGAVGQITEHNDSGDDDDVRAQRWEVSDGEGDFGWHREEELEHVD